MPPPSSASVSTDSTVSQWGVKNYGVDDQKVPGYPYGVPGQFNQLPPIVGAMPVSSSLNPSNADLSQGLSLNAISGYSGSNSTSPGFVGPDPYEGSQAPLKFPSQLAHATHKWPMISFSVRLKSSGERRIFLPIPAGITFSDSMSYSSIDLGIMGTIGANAITAASKQSSITGALAAGIGAFAGSAVDKAKKLNVAAAASIAMRQFRQDGIANIIDFSQRQVVAPNTNTTFQNSGVRSFVFSFKMMPRSKDEATTISAIVKTLRQNMYPKGNDVILTYPPIWDIKFYDGEGRQNTKIPQIYSSYLTGMTATYNSGSNMFHEDGNPTETDIQIQFQETKALTLTDIVALSEK